MSDVSSHSSRLTVSGEVSRGHQILTLGFVLAPFFWVDSQLETTEILTSRASFSPSAHIGALGRLTGALPPRLMERDITTCDLK